ncbi:MAG: sel1 repeat family protein [Campylobacter sp.]|nr:sel1 repeat family protein [Campylobacter sp.]
MKIFFLSFLCLIFSACSWQSALSFGLAKSDEEILASKAKDELDKKLDKCEKLQDSIACREIGANFLYHKDYEKAKHYYKLSCQYNFYASCANLGQIYEQGLDGVVDKERALAYYKLGCANMNGESCYNEAILLRDNTKIEPNEVKLLLAKSCKYSYDKACTMLRKLNK